MGRAQTLHFMEGTWVAGDFGFTLGSWSQSSPGSRDCANLLTCCLVTRCGPFCPSSQELPHQSSSLKEGLWLRSDSIVTAGLAHPLVFLLSFFISPFLFVHVCVHMDVCVYVCVHSCASGGQKSTLDVTLQTHPLPVSWDRVSHWPGKSACFHFLRAGLTNMHRRSSGLQALPHSSLTWALGTLAYMAGTLLTLASSQPLQWVWAAQFLRCFVTNL